MRIAHAAATPPGTASPSSTRRSRSLPTLTVAENMMIDRFPRRGGLIDRGAMRARCAAVLDTAGLRLRARPRGRDGSSIGDRQMVEIGRALLAEPAIVILDEPTSSLTSREKERLFGVVAGAEAARA